jgi:hypothetical protein
VQFFLATAKRRPKLVFYLVKLVELPPGLRNLDGFGGAPLIQLDSSGTTVARPTLPSRAGPDTR